MYFNYRGPPVPNSSGFNASVALFDGLVEVMGTILKVRTPYTVHRASGIWHLASGIWVHLYPLVVQLRLALCEGRHVVRLLLYQLPGDALLTPAHPGGTLDKAISGVGIGGSERIGGPAPLTRVPAQRQHSHLRGAMVPPAGSIRPSRSAKEVRRWTQGAARAPARSVPGSRGDATVSVPGARHGRLGVGCGSAVWPAPGSDAREGDRAGRHPPPAPKGDPHRPAPAAWPLP